MNIWACLLSIELTLVSLDSLKLFTILWNVDGEILNFREGAVLFYCLFSQLVIRWQILSHLAGK